MTRQHAFGSFGLMCLLAGMHGFEGDAENHCTVCMYDPERKAPQIDIDISSFMPRCVLSMAANSVATGILL